LRQGDLLVPFFFLIAAEGLAGVSRTAFEKDLIETLEIGNKSVKVNMFQYIGDTLFFCKAKIKSVFNIKVMLNGFELTFGLKVNFSRSSLGRIGVEQTEILHFATILNCEVMRIPFKYLGMSVGGVIKGVSSGMKWLTG